ncbi:cystathionine gamma-synthase [Halorubrum sp. 48-1-W]|uniref:trans-sulfuration enzyme family protein n=1 Tax=Halorubrum sp. 48-1-W TaxID=2249761 RepID=UPI000DCCFE63|nr:PLP-dependent aspartate aminotransferase family protein [Halorubrum sp. 48-1-W]RAW46131.1 cystathionine gamma-synthase [Halorubrum sp. 48-1-W]
MDHPAERADHDFETEAIHAGEEPDLGPGGTGDLVSPVHLSSTFAMDEAGAPSHGYKYSRLGNPTRTALDRRVATLSGADHAMTFASGMAAIATTCLTVLESGDHVVAFDGIYGGTKVLFDEYLAEHFDVTVEYVDATDADVVADAVTAETALCWMESPTNPLLKLCDVEAIAGIADRHGALLAVDNTFATPYFQRPLSLGADVSVYSTTKYLNGHTDSIGGAVVTDDDALAERIRFVQEYALGAMLSPFDCYLVLRGSKTLPLRMRQHETNATRVAEFLSDHPAVTAVHYPGLESHPQHDLAVRQMDGFGGVVSFEVDGEAAEARAFVESLDLFTLAVSLGSVESLIEHPASMSASYVPEEERLASGITDSLIRAPIGTESADDLIADLERGLQHL